MNDKLIIEKQAELIREYENKLKFMFDYDPNLETKYRGIKSQIATLLVQNEGKETKETVGSAETHEKEYGFVLDIEKIWSSNQPDWAKRANTLNVIIEITEALDKRDHSVSPTMSKDELFEEIKQFILWFDGAKYLIATDEVVREYVNSKSEE